MMHINPLTPVIGAEISGVDMGATLSAQAIDDLAAALVEHKVLFFRNQDIDQRQHIDFAAQFGELEVHPFVENLADYPEVIRLHNDAQRKPGGTAMWHSDVTWRQEPSLGSILLCRVCPPTGGDTLFANMEAAYERLDEATQAHIEDMVAVHDFRGFFQSLVKRGASPEEIADYQEKYPEARHPVVRTHPVSGRKSLHVNAIFTQRLEGLDEQESNALLQRLC